jgi:hypothetical protein
MFLNSLGEAHLPPTLKFKLAESKSQANLECKFNTRPERVRGAMDVRAAWIVVVRMMGGAEPVIDDQ